MYSVNAPVPPEVERVARGLEEPLRGFDRVVDEFTLVVKRLGRRRREDLARAARTIEEVLGGWGLLAARTGSLGIFADPPAGRGPVVYISVESPGLSALHAELLEAVGTVNPDVEGVNYVPHITIARGGNRTELDAVTDLEVRTVDWTIDSLSLFDAKHGQPTRRFSLPAKR